MIEFRDSQFMSAREKRNIIRDWECFVKNGFKFHHFTKALYLHLSLRCEFIAHFNRAGFYATYFEDPDDTIRFLGQFDADLGCRSVEYGSSRWADSPDYADVNRAMCKILEPHKEHIYETLRARARERDVSAAKALLQKHGIAISVV